MISVIVANCWAPYLLASLPFHPSVEVQAQLIEAFVNQSLIESESKFN